MSGLLTDAAAYVAIASLLIGFVGFLLDAGFHAFGIAEFCLKTCCGGLIASIALGVAAWIA